MGVMVPLKRPPGRPKGTPNKASTAREGKIAATGHTPLSYLISILQDPMQDVPTRMDAAKAAAPYVHPRLAQVELRGEVEHRFVARLPEPSVEPLDWQRRHAPVIEGTATGSQLPQVTQKPAGSIGTAAAPSQPVRGNVANGKGHGS